MKNMINRYHTKIENLEVNIIQICPHEIKPMNGIFKPVTTMKNLFSKNIKSCRNNITSLLFLYTGIYLQ